jgi:predicted N-acetyltransferase YhbS
VLSLGSAKQDGVGVSVRAARPSEYAETGALTLAAYTLDNLLDDDSDYAHELRDAASRAEYADLLVAVDEDGHVVGTVTFCLPGSPYAELCREGQAEFRMLAVDPQVRGQGVGERLVRACLDRAADKGCSSVVISTRPQMASAHRIYDRLSFQRTPELDWTPAPGIELIAYTRALGDTQESAS